MSELLSGVKPKIFFDASNESLNTDKIFKASNVMMGILEVVGNFR